MLLGCCDTIRGFHAEQLQEPFLINKPSTVGAARLLGVRRHTLLNWLEKGPLPGQLTARGWRLIPAIWRSFAPPIRCPPAGLGWSPEGRESGS
ncbi:MAG: MerR family transcriptional regulator [Chloroflexota bacterium]